jgi:integrase
MTTPAPAKGLYQQEGKLTWWLRFSRGGKQIRVSLGTRDFGEAVAKAAEIRAGQGPKEIKAKVWETAIAAYTKEKVAKGDFRAGTAGKAASAIKVFARETGAATPDVVTLPMLQSYYETRAKNSEAGARSTIATIQGFLAWGGCLPGRVVYGKAKPEARNVVLTPETINDWIREAKTDRLRFVLYCAGHAGMRAGEIRHSLRSWFDLDRRVISIPAKENEWQTKNSDGREIPISAPFAEFLGSFLAGKDGLLLVGRKGKPWDFRLPLDRHAIAMGRPEVFPHAFRHSWITALCNSGNHTIMQVSSWSGDRIETIEKNYWHKRTETGALDATMAGVKRDEETARQLAQILAAAQVLHSSTY